MSTFYKQIGLNSRLFRNKQKIFFFTTISQELNRLEQALFYSFHSIFAVKLFIYLLVLVQL